MKEYIFYFTLPDNSRIYITDIFKAEVATEYYLVMTWPDKNPEEFKTHVQRIFTKVWVENPDYSKQEIWKGLTLDEMKLEYHEVPACR